MLGKEAGRWHRGRRLRVDVHLKFAFPPQTRCGLFNLQSYSLPVRPPSRLMAVLHGLFGLDLRLEVLAYPEIPKK